MSTAFPARRRRLLLLALLCASAGLAALLWTDGHAGLPTDAIQDARPGRAWESAGSAVLARPRDSDVDMHDSTEPEGETSSTSERTRWSRSEMFARFASTREFLSDYWGSDWPRVEAELREARIDPERTNIHRMPSWDGLQPWLLEELRKSAERACREADSRWLGWGAGQRDIDLGSPHVNPEAKHISTQQLAEVQAIVERHDHLIRAACQAYCAHLQDALLTLLGSGEVVKHPVFTPSFAQPKVPSDAYSVLVLTVDGWTMTFVATASQFPGLEVAWRLAEHEHVARHHAVVEYIRSL